jgi:FkbM family methyltransferase
MRYGVLVNGDFEERSLIKMTAPGFSRPMLGRSGTYDEYVMKEINRSYGKLDVKNRVVLDIGANIGCFSLWALGKGARHVISLEPELNNFNMLELNLKDETNFSLYNEALAADKDGEGILYLSKTGKNPGNSSTTPRRGRIGVLINYMSVAQLKEYHPDIDVAKVDCEGAEYDFMKTLVEAYPNMRQVALEIHISGFGLLAAISLHNLMLDAGFTAIVPPRLDNESLWQTLATYER